MSRFSNYVMAVNATRTWENRQKPWVLAWAIWEQGENRYAINGMGVLARNADNYHSLHQRPEMIMWYPNTYLLQNTTEKDNNYVDFASPQQEIEGLMRFLERPKYSGFEKHMGSFEELLRFITPAFCPTKGYVERVLSFLPEAEAELRKVGWKPEEEPMPEPVPFKYTVNNNLLYFGGAPVLSYASPNYWKLRINKPTSIVFHYTASEGYKGIASWFMNPASKVSPHLLICKDSNVIQFVPFHKPAWHSGSDKYNCSSIGIELENLGCSRIKIGSKVVFNMWGGPKFVDEKDCIYAAHRLEPRILRWWPKYTTALYDAINRIIPVLRNAYGPLALLGQDMLGVQKIDPGPAFDYRQIGG